MFGLSPDLPFFQVTLLSAPLIAMRSAAPTVTVQPPPLMDSSSTLSALSVTPPPLIAMVLHSPVNLYVPPPWLIATTGSFLQSQVVPFVSDLSALASAGVRARSRQASF